MKIAELEAHHDAYAESEQTIRAMVDNGEFPKVFSVCTASFPHIVPAINYRKKRGIMPEMPDFSAFTTIWKYAPPLFEHTAIESLFEFVNSSRVLVQSEKNFLDSIEAARKREQLAHRLWNHLERHPGMLQRDIRTELGVVQEDAVNIVELWEELGITGSAVGRQKLPALLSYSTRYGSGGPLSQLRCARQGAKGAILPVGCVSEMRHGRLLSYRVR